MKKVVFILGLLIATSCENNGIAKPDHLLSEEKMEEILFDLTILQAADASIPQNLNDNNIEVGNYIYKKHNIDSATFYQNHKYYASNAKKFKRMYTHVSDKLKEVKNQLDTSLVKKTNLSKPSLQEKPLPK